MPTNKKLLKELQFDKQLDVLSKKYNNKKIILYGAGKFFYTIKENYDLKKLNIIAISDKKFSDITAPIYDETLGYNKISPEAISSLKPDIVLLSLINDFYAEKYFREDLFLDKSKQFKYKVLLTKPLTRKIQEAFLTSIGMRWN